MEIPTTSLLIFAISHNNIGCYHLIGNTLKILWTFVKESFVSTCFLFQSSEDRRELGGGSLSRPKATSGVRAGRESWEETMKLDMWTLGWRKENRAAWVGKSRQISSKIRRNSSQKSAPLFSLCYKGMLKIPSLWLDPKHPEVNGISVGVGSGHLKEEQL